MRKTLELVILPLLAASIFINLIVFSVKPTVLGRDELGYTSIAHKLNRSGVFTDGRYAPFSAEKNVASHNGEVPGRFFAPAYPAFLALMAKLDDNVDVSLACAAEGKKPCNPKRTYIADIVSCSTKGVDGCASKPFKIPTSITVIQVMLAIFSALMVFYIGYYLSDGKEVVAWLTMIPAIYFIVVALHYYIMPNRLLTENLAFFSFYGFLYFLVIAWTKASRLAISAAGLMLGLTVMTRPAYLYLYYFAVPAVFLLYHYARREGIKYGLIFAFSTLVLVAPWMGRNYIHFGDFSLTNGYQSFILVGRVAYNTMSWPEWFVSFVYWLPGFGEQLAAMLFEPQLYEKLSMDGAMSCYETYLAMGECGFRDQTIAAAGGLENHFSYLLHEHLLGDLFKHIMVTIPLTLNGIYLDSYLSLIGILLFIPVARILYRKQQLTGLMLITLPPLFMAGLQGFVSVSIGRYNAPMAVIYSFVIAYFFHHLWTSRLRLRVWSAIKNIPD
jgi:hypothetical protein